MRAAGPWEACSNRTEGRKKGQPPHRGNLREQTRIDLWRYVQGDTKSWKSFSENILRDTKRGGYIPLDLCAEGWLLR